VDGSVPKFLPEDFSLYGYLLTVTFRYALRRSVIASNPTTDLELPAGADEEMRFASKAEAAAYIDALPVEDQALWATAFYAGLRRGELQALRWSNVELGNPAAFTVLKAWSAGEGAPKTKAGVRRVPIVPSLKKLLESERARTKRSGNDLVFGRTASDPFVPSTVRARSQGVAGPETPSSADWTPCCPSYRREPHDRVGGQSKGAERRYGPCLNRDDLQHVRASHAWV
jgi:integrase